MPDFKDKFSELANNKAELEQEIQKFNESYTIEDDEHTENTLNPEVQSLAFELIYSIFQNFGELEEKIKPFIKSGTIETIDRVKRLGLLLGGSEILYSAKTPLKVAINEAVNITQKYSNVESAAFVNAILDKLAKQKEML